MTNCALMILMVVSQADSIPKLDQTQMVKLLEPHYQSQAAQYQFFLDQDRREPLEFVRAPVMRWTAEGNSGAVWVWTRFGRAEVIGCLGSFINGVGKLEQFHEFHALTLRPLPPVSIANVRNWATTKPGVELKRIEESEVPAATDKLRLIQLRNLARQFTASMKSGSQMHVLRLSSSPLFRYTGTNPEVLDGALFSYLWDNGTDPELLLLLEARAVSPRTAPDSATPSPTPLQPTDCQWWYAPVRFTWRELWLKHRDREVWHAERHDESHRRQTLLEPYVTLPIGELDLESLRNASKTDTLPVNDGKGHGTLPTNKPESKK